MENLDNLTSLKQNNKIYVLGSPSPIIDFPVSPIDYTVYIDNKRSFTVQFFSVVKDVELGASGSFSILEETKEKESYLGKTIQLTVKLCPDNDIPRILFDAKVFIKTESFSISIDDIILSRVYAFVMAE